MSRPASEPRRSRPPILLTGATGYVGGRLLRLFEERGERVCCLTRRPEAVTSHRDTTTIMFGDVLEIESLRSAMCGVETAYYLVHSMTSAANFEQRDRRGAGNFAAAARDAGVRRIVYLGGLGSGSDLSSHLASRQEVGRILAHSGVQTIEFRASIVIGSGSLSFEMLRKLVERLPVMVTPRWVRTTAQPIAIEDVLDYLVAALDVELEGSTVFEIGGPDQVSYEDLMREYARQLGIRRRIIPVPFLTARLSSLWLGLVTPVYARVGRKLIDSLPHETVVRSAKASRAFPIRPRGYREAIARALANEDRTFSETRWSDAVSSPGLRRGRYGGVRHGKRLVDSRAIQVRVSPAQAFCPIRRIGGETGWYFGNRLWRLRGFIDVLVGGVGVRRGRLDPEMPAVGSALDFWRVEAYEPNRLLRLRAEMKLPGRAWLQFEVDGDDDGSTIRQTAIFHPTGLLGTAYWYGLFPVHSWIFKGMLTEIADAAQAPDEAGDPLRASAPSSTMSELPRRIERPDVVPFSSRMGSLVSPTPTASKRLRRHGSVPDPHAATDADAKGTTNEPCLRGATTRHTDP